MGNRATIITQDLPELQGPTAQWFRDKWRHKFNVDGPVISSKTEEKETPGGEFARDLQTALIDVGFFVSPYTLATVAFLYEDHDAHIAYIYSYKMWTVYVPTPED